MTERAEGRMAARQKRFAREQRRAAEEGAKAAEARLAFTLAQEKMHYPFKTGDRIVVQEPGRMLFIGSVTRIEPTRIRVLDEKSSRVVILFRRWYPRPSTAKELAKGERVLERLRREAREKETASELAARDSRDVLADHLFWKADNEHALHKLSLSQLKTIETWVERLTPKKKGKN